MPLSDWMQEVRALHAQAPTLDVDVVHDLRVALRRCRSLAQGLAAVDVTHAKSWRALSRAGRDLFDGLGHMRDAQVMRGWLAEVLPVDEPARAVLVQQLDVRIATLAQDAGAAVAAFDVTTWDELALEMPERATAVMRNVPLLQHLALRRHHEAHALHVHAMRARTAESLHELRIGVKRLRYTIESFLPDVHDVVGKLLKKMQESLGELHDFDVLAAFVAVDSAIDDEARARVQQRLAGARAQRLADYKHLATGRGGAWTTLRRALPRGIAMHAAHRAHLVEIAHAHDVDDLRIGAAHNALEKVAGAFSIAVDDALRDAMVLALIPRRRRRVRLVRALPLATGWSEQSRALLLVALGSPVVRAARVMTDVVLAAPVGD